MRRPGISQTTVSLTLAACLVGGAALRAQAPPDTTEATKKKAAARAKAGAAVQPAGASAVDQTPAAKIEQAAQAPVTQKQPAQVSRGAVLAQLPATTVEKLQAARQAQSAGRFDEAARGYEGALGDLGSNDGAARAEISLSYAQALERWPQKGAPPPADRLVRAEALYRASIAAGTPAQQSLARNNLGTLQLRQGNYQAAVDTLQAIDMNAVPAQRFAYQYNLGRAIEQSGRPDEALDRYLDAMRQEPSFGPARAAAVELVLTSKAPAGKAARRLGDLLLDQGRPDTSADLARKLLSRGAGENTPQILGLLMRSYIAQSIDLERFRQTEVPFLSELDARGGTRGLAGDIEAAMLDTGLKPVTKSYRRGEVFKAWSRVPDTSDFAALLKYSGDLYARGGDASQALARYATAWTFDHSNGESAVYCALTIRDHPKVDPDHVVLNALIEGIFADKMDFIRAEDWPNSLRMHLVLGSIFEQLGQWGPPTDSHSAAYQYQAALADERRILAKDKSFSRSPGLYTKLGEAYAHLGREADARFQFEQAALAFAASGRQDAAEAMAERARAVKVP